MNQSTADLIVELTRVRMEREYLAAMLAAYDGAVLGKNCKKQTIKWLAAATQAVNQG